MTDDEAHNSKVLAESAMVGVDAHRADSGRLRPAPPPLLLIYLLSCYANLKKDGEKQDHAQCHHVASTPLSLPTEFTKHVQHAKKSKVVCVPKAF
eukprot:362846-Chlamydomonas_euryale.AAC.4